MRIRCLILLILEVSNILKNPLMLLSNNLSDSGQNALPAWAASEQLFYLIFLLHYLIF